MYAHIQHYGPAVDAVTAEQNPNNDELVALRIEEGAAHSGVTLHRATWQQVVDQLAALGIVATPPASTVETYECDRCGAAFGIAGSGSSWDDHDADDYFADQVRFHEAGECKAVSA